METDRKIVLVLCMHLLSQRTPNSGRLSLPPSTYLLPSVADHTNIASSPQDPQTTADSMLISAKHLSPANADVMPLKQP